MHSTSRHQDLQQVQTTMSMVLAGGAQLSPLYNGPECRVSNGPSAIVVLILYMRLLVHTCMQAYDSWGYVHTCTIRPDFVTATGADDHVYMVVSGGGVVHNSPLYNL